MPGSWGKINPLRVLAKGQQHRASAAAAAAELPPQAGQSVADQVLQIRPWSLKNSVKRTSKSDRSEQSGNEREHKITIRDEDLDLLGEVSMSGMVSSLGSNIQEDQPRQEVNAKLTSKALIWGLRCLRLEDIVAVSYCDGSRRFTVHSFAISKSKWMPDKIVKSKRKRVDLHFLAPNSEEVLQWVSAFAEQGCFINYSRHPLASSKKKGSVVDAGSSPSPSIRCKSRPSVLVILNPRSGRGRARKVFTKAEPVLKLAGFRLRVVETTSARHAQTLASTVDLSTCPDGIICVGGDGIINEVLNGLLSRENAQEASQVPIGIIPAGSDNSLVWTVLGISDPVSAAVAIVKGGTVSLDVFSVEWTKTGAVHLGCTIAYYGFMSDVLELSAKYQKRFGPLRYFVAGAIRLLRLPHYKCELEYLPASEGSKETTNSSPYQEPLFLEHDIFEERSSDPEATPSVEALFRVSDSDVCATNEPSDYVRGLDAKTKRQISGRAASLAGTEEALAVHHSLPSATSPTPRPRTRSKSRSERSWSGLSLDCESALARISRASSVQSAVDGECAVNGLGPPKWDVPFDSSSKSDSLESTEQQAEQPKWQVRQGPILGVMVCNHQCKTVQCLPSQVLAPSAEHDDGTLDLMVVRGVGRFQLLRFFWLMQFNRHLKLPFVEYVKVRQVVLKTGSNAHQGCGIDGELLTLNGPISTSLLPYKCRLIGRARQCN